MTSRTRVSLALGGGGARGYAHIGVLQVLEEHGYDVVGISGTSMGSLVAALHAKGVVAEYTDWVTHLTQRDVIRLLDPALRSPGAIKGARVMARVSELLDGARIEDLPIPFTAVATDLLNRKEVWFQEGPVDMAVRASIALPSFITPVMLNGRLLADGGMMNPVPIAPLSGLDVDLTIAVNVNGAPLHTSRSSQVAESAEPRPVSEWQEKLRRSASQVFDNETGRRLTTWLAARRAEGDHHADEPSHAPAHEAAEPEFEDLPSDLGMLSVMELSLDALQSVVTRYRLASYPPDVMITMPKDICKTLDFHRAGELIEVGREYAEKALARGTDPEDLQPDRVQL
ncbi:patatin-like phospholipase family protein [Nocardioides daphniae]|uniref:Esterase n=1 Tax=Nocardioides daphniae TaxID=402297 RepID=A0A4P7UEI5_9ACTN|nr:patatin-like phospholipase family protein [Nocardioides daphniae]QCC77768.1 esterase [Nocardioides daphniae]GGD28613.1 putative NTE family protein [Nocardioides daphniae]